MPSLRSGLAALATELEQATEGSRTADIAIDRLIRPSRYKPKSGEAGVKLPAGFGTDAISLSMHSAPHYTASLDAALSLVPEDAWIEMRRPHDGRKPIARLDINRHPYTCAAEAETLPLALCIAALRARADASASEPRTEGERIPPSPTPTPEKTNG